MEALVLANSLQKLDGCEKARRARQALEQAEFGFSRTVTPPLAALVGLAVFAMAIGLVA